MNKKIVVILIAVVVVAIVGISQFFPLPSSDTEGTIGKVNKYRDSSVSEEDVRFRNALLEDPEALKSTIETLEFYQEYMTAFSSEVAECQQEMAALDTGKNTLAKEIQGLNDLNTFLDNNLKTVAQTKQMLADCQGGDQPAKGADLDNRLIQFGDFAVNLNQKDKAIDKAFEAVDASIDRSQFEENGEADAETQKLVNVRERMLGMGVIHASVLGNAERMNFYCANEILNMSGLNSSLNFYCGKIAAGKAGDIASKINAAQLNNFFSKEALGYVIHGSKEQLGPKAASKEQLGVIHSKDQLGVLRFSKEQLAVHSGRELGSVLALDKLGYHMKSGRVEMKSLNVFGKEQLGGTWSKEQLGYWGKANLGNAAAFSKQLSFFGF